MNEANYKVGPMTEGDIEQLARRALDESVAAVDANTLSRLNQARHLAFEDSAKPAFWRGWIPATASACAAIALALAIALPATMHQVAQPTDKSLIMPALTEEVSLAALEDKEMLEDLDMMLWLIEVENHAS